MTVLLAMPILIPLFVAILQLLAWRTIVLQRWLGVAGTTALLVAGLALFRQVWLAGIQTLSIGNWAAPFGITLVADLLSVIMLVLVALVGLSAAIYALATMDRQREADGYHLLVQILLMALSGALLTGDLFNLFVWFEVMLISSFVLLALGGGRNQIEGAFKYVTLNLFASSLFLAAVGILYGATGTLNMADLARQFAPALPTPSLLTPSLLTPSLPTPSLLTPGLMTTLAMLFLIAFGIKSALFPLFFWLPAAYHTAPPVISAIFAGLLTKVGVYVLLRIFTLLFVQDVAYTHTLLLWIAGLTMVIGVLGAAAQTEMRRILSFHIVSQIGYMVMGLALFTPLALTGAIFFVAHNIIVKTNLFLISGVVLRLQGTEKLKKLGGLYQSRPALTALFLISALALAGLPPFSGFWAKLLLVQAGLATEAYAIVAVSLVVSVLTLYSMTKIWNEAFWKNVGDQAHALTETAPLSRFANWSMMAPIVCLVTLAVGMGLAVEPLLQIAERAAMQLLDTTAYIDAVLGVEAIAVQ